MVVRQLAARHRLAVAAARGAIPGMAALGQPPAAVMAALVLEVGLAVALETTGPQVAVLACTGLELAVLVACLLKSLRPRVGRAAWTG